MRWTVIDSAVVTSLRLVQDTAMVFGWPFSLSLNRWRNVSAGTLARSRLIVVRINLLLLSEISKFLSLSFLAVQDNALWQAILGHGIVKEVEMLPMMFQIRLHGSSSWLFLFIVDSDSWEIWAWTNDFATPRNASCSCALLKDQKMQGLSEFA